MCGIMLGLAGCIGLALNDQVRLATWILIGLMLVLNIINMFVYGIATSASAAYLIPILLAMFCISTTIGYVVTLLGCGIVFGIAYLQSQERIKTLIPYQVSHLTFDAPVLSLVYILIAFITGSWIGPLKEFLFQ